MLLSLFSSDSEWLRETWNTRVLQRAVVVKDYSRLLNAQSIFSHFSFVFVFAFFVAFAWCCTMMLSASERDSHTDHRFSSAERTIVGVCVSFWESSGAIFRHLFGFLNALSTSRLGGRTRKECGGRDWESSKQESSWGLRCTFVFVFGSIEEVQTRHSWGVASFSFSLNQPEPLRWMTRFAWRFCMSKAEDVNRITSLDACRCLSKCLSWIFLTAPYNDEMIIFTPRNVYARHTQIDLSWSNLCFSYSGFRSTAKIALGIRAEAEATSKLLYWHSPPSLDAIKAHRLGSSPLQDKSKLRIMAERTPRHKEKLFHELFPWLIRCHE